MVERAQRPVPLSLSTAPTLPHVRSVIADPFGALLMRECALLLLVALGAKS